MKKNIIGLISGLVSVLLFLSGCIRPTWVMVNGPFKMTSENYEVMLPEGWKQYTPAEPVLMITRDGTSLQKIRIARYEIGGKETPFTQTKKKVQEGMLPHELAEVVLDDLRSNPNILNLQVKKNVPATVAGHHGFQLVYTYKTQSELTQNVEAYGFVLGKLYYVIAYDAPARYYFERDLATFEKVKDSFAYVP